MHYRVLTSTLPVVFLFPDSFSPSHGILSGRLCCACSTVLHNKLGKHVLRRVPQQLRTCRGLAGKGPQLRSLVLHLFSQHQPPSQELTPDGDSTNPITRADTHLIT
jgi:hypothetical protein